MKRGLFLFIVLIYAANSFAQGSSNIKILSPNGGEVFLAGSDTVITWSGIPTTDTVQIEYSIDSGKSWSLITDKATGGKYVIHLPILISNTCFVRVSKYTSVNERGWMLKGGGNSSDVGKDASPANASPSVCAAMVTPSADKKVRLSIIY